MSPEERDQLIQRYFDGETIGNEAAQAERLLAEDPAARELLESLKDLSDSFKAEVAHAVEAEDFSAWWGDIADRLPDGPPTLDTLDTDLALNGFAEGVVRSEAAPLQGPSGLAWLRQVLFGPGLVVAGLAAVLMALFAPPTWLQEAAPALVDYHVEIESIDSDGDLVMVTQENEDTPLIVWVNEVDG